MSSKLNDLYQVQKNDSRRAAEVLADAFQQDPVWQVLFRNTTPAQRIAAFEAPVRYCLKYGSIYAPSTVLEGVAAWTVGALADMTPWRMLLSGAIWAGLQMGMNVATKMKQVFAPIEADRKATIHGKPFNYLLVIGIASQFQGQGHGGKLLRALIAESEQARVPIYLETQTESNVRLYEYFGFEVVKEIVLPVVALPMWEMVREA